MKRYKTAELEVGQDRNIKEFLPLFVLAPTADKMASFASQFSKAEWEFLCRNTYFMHLIDHDLDKARKVAGTLLKRSLD
jgi:hypothetical protein